MEIIIYYFFIFLAEAAILWQYTQTLFTARYTAKIRAAVLFGLYLILFIVSIFDSKWMNIVFYFILNFIFIITQYRLNICSACFHSSILTSVMMLCEGIVYYMTRYFLPGFLESNHFYQRTIFAILSKLIFFTLISILVRFLKERQDYNEADGISVFLLFLIPLTSIFVMISFIKISDSCVLSPLLNGMLTLSAVFLLTINLLVFGIDQYNRKKNLEFTEMQLLFQKESDRAQYYAMLLSQHENQSILIHDIKKHLQSINALNGQREHDKIKLYIQELLQSSDLKESSRLCDHEMLNTILARYGHQCLNKQISFHADIRSGIIDFISDADMTSLFCNLLDNAVKAAGHISDSFIEVSACGRENTPFIVITVVNSCRKNPFERQTGRPITMKTNKRKHGFGVKSVQKIVNKYHGDIQMYYDEHTLTFHVIITLKPFPASIA